MRYRYPGSSSTTSKRIVRIDGICFYATLGCPSGSYSRSDEPFCVHAFGWMLEVMFRPWYLRSASPDTCRADRVCLGGTALMTSRVGYPRRLRRTQCASSLGLARSLSVHY